MATAKKVNAKKPASKRSKVTRKAKVVPLKSFVIVKENVPFFTFKITDQTVYWLILLILIFALGLWVVNIQINIANIIDEINVITSQL